MTDNSSARRRCSVVSSASAGPSSTVRSADITSGGSFGVSFDGVGSSAISAPIVRARQRSGNPMTAAAGPVGHALVGRQARGHEFFVVLGNPAGDAFELIAVWLARATLGDERGVLRSVLHGDNKARSGKPSLRLPQQRVRHLPRVERRVDRTDQLNQRVPAIQPVLQSARPLPETGGQICLSAAGGGWIGARCSRHLREKANSR